MGRGPIDTFTRSSSLLPPPSAGEPASQNRHERLLSSVTVISVVTGTPSIEYLANAAVIRSLNAQQSFAMAANAANLFYFAVRDALPASPDRSDAVRILNAPNVLTTSVYADDEKGSRSTIAMNLVRKSYEVLLRDTEVSFGERVWNGLLDRAAEMFVLGLLRDAPEGSDQSKGPGLVKFTIVRKLDTPLPFDLSQEQMARIRERLAAKSVLAYPDGTRVGDSDAVYWEIASDGTTEDWDRFDRHQILE